MDHHQHPPPCGRLILILDEEPFSPSLRILRRLLHHLDAAPEVTLLAGPHRRAVLAALRHDHRGVVYNTTDELLMAEAIDFLPWRHIYAVAAGRVWMLSPHTPAMPSKWDEPLPSCAG
jgi:hypothetical protein